MADGSTGLYISRKISSISGHMPICISNRSEGGGKIPSLTSIGMNSIVHSLNL